MRTIHDEIQQQTFSSSGQRAVVNVLFTAGWLQDRHADFLKPFGLSVQQFNILRILRGQQPKPASIMLLKERMIDKNSDASRLVDRLFKKGLVIRRECPSDRRQMDVTISEAGLSLLAQIDRESDQMNRLIQTLTDAEADQLSYLLDKLRSEG
ncbi:MAG: MarR family transcriptional regulator [Bacteroidetes bacterium]|nr:MarR family transcriptional regulator [Bacteroidota bacterium]